MSTTLHTEIVNDLLKLAVESGASDIVIKSEKPGYLRLGGRLRSVEMDPISCEHAQAFVDEMVPRIFKDKWDKDGQVDFAYAADDIGRLQAVGGCVHLDRVEVLGVVGKFVESARTGRRVEHPVDERRPVVVPVPERPEPGRRGGDQVGIRRGRDLDLAAGNVRVDRSAYPNPDGGYFIDTPKSRAGHRTIAIPNFLVVEMETHLNTFVKNPSADALVFPTRTGECAYGAAQTAITRALREMGRSDIRVHDLRHTGQVLAAQSGATLADLKARLGHSSVNAAMKYAHAAGDHGRQIADRMDAARQ